jgi:hypothetical protein
MNFDRLLSSAEVVGNLFVQFASDDVFEHFAFTRCKRGQARGFPKVRPAPADGRAVFVNRHTNGCKQVCIVHGLGEKSTAPCFIASTLFGMPP